LEDWEWLLRFASHFDLELVPEPLARVYRKGHVAARVVEESTFRLVDLYQKEARKYGATFQRRFLAKRWLHLSLLFFSEGQGAKGLSYLFRSLWQDPLPPPGMLLMILDGALGTRLAPWASALRRDLLAREAQ
jgi:hypothetical protein